MSPSPENHFENQVIRASAGTGKTFALSNRFLRLLACGVEMETILATTFTRKGAGEILDRIVQRLARASMDGMAADTLAEQLEMPGLDQRRCRELLGGMMKNLHRLQIGTLDSFFHRIADAFGQEMGLPADWSIVELQQIGLLRDQVIREILRENTVEDLLHLLNPGEAGRKVADQIRNVVALLSETWLDAEPETWNRLPQLKSYRESRDFSDAIDVLEALTYPHGNQKKQILKEMELVRKCQWKELATRGIIKAIVSGTNSYYKPLPEACVKAYLPIVEQCRGCVIDMLSRRNLATFRLLDEVGQRLETEKLRHGEMRFDDITRKLQEFIAEVDMGRFFFRLDHKINHLLLDEFQDTSNAQWNILRPFARRTTAANGDTSFFCVGDPKQAIFGWRSGVAEIFESVEHDLSNISPAPPLTTSYRSAPAVIETVNQVFLNLDRFQPTAEGVRPAVVEWAKRFQPHQTNKTGLSGCVTMEYASDGDRQSEKSPDEQMLGRTVDLICQLHEQRQGRSIGVLCRTNDSIGKLIFMLQQAGIPASEEGGNPLTDSAAVETVLSAMQLADHPGDSIARFHLSNGPLAESLGLEPENAWIQATDRDAANAARQLLVAAANLASEKIREQLSSQGYGPTAEKLARILASHCTRRELSRLQQLVQQAFNYDSSHDEPGIRLRASRFVSYIRDEYRASDESSAPVRVMTIHKSKGLEFDVVVLPMKSSDRWGSRPEPLIIGRESATSPIQLVSRYVNADLRRLLPSEFEEAVQSQQKSEVMDALSLLYVAMTRAIHATHIVMSYGCTPDKASAAGVLLSTLVPDWTSELRDNGLIFTHGEPDWHHKLPKADPTEKSTESNAYYLPAAARLTPVELAAAHGTGRGVRRISPSELEGGALIRMSSIFATLANSKKLGSASMIHACFEKIGWLEDGIPDRELLVEHLNSRGGFCESEDSVVDAFERLIRKPNLSSLLTRSSYLSDWLPDVVDPKATKRADWRLDYANERTFAINIDQQLMQGSIDRLVLIYNGDRLVAADIIDYKTDDVEEQNVESRIDFYRPQLAAYRMAVSRFCKLPVQSISTRLVFVELDAIVKLDWAVDPLEIAPSTVPEESANAANKAAAASEHGAERQLKMWSDE